MKGINTCCGNEQKKEQFLIQELYSLYSLILPQDMKDLSIKKKYKKTKGGGK